jgi:UDP-GlcNAc:undecaprenyl-phosphate GlcNAc-1-phosphate transferase
MWLTLFGSFGGAFALAMLAAPLAIWLGKRLGMLARPDGRRRHQGEISRLGGLSLFVGFEVVAVALYWLRPLPDPADRLRLAGVMIGSAFIFGVGWLDDRFELSARWQLLGQTVAAMIAIATTVIIERFTNPFTAELLVLQWWLYIPLSWFWIVGMINTVNWLDGLDGLAVGVGAIAAALFAIHLYQLGKPKSRRMHWLCVGLV